MSLQDSTCLFITGRNVALLGTDVVSFIEEKLHANLVFLQTNAIADWDVPNQLGFDMEELMVRFQHVKSVVFMPRIPAWKERISDLMQYDWQCLSNLLNAASASQVERFIFISDIEAMGSSPRPLKVDESSLWSGQTKANEIQKYWYLCEQECRRAAEEGLPLTIITASAMEKDPSNPRVHNYGSPQTLIIKALASALHSKEVHPKIFAIEKMSEESPIPESKPGFLGRLFSKSTPTWNHITFDDSITQELFLE